mgnify:FL=1
MYPLTLERKYNKIFQNNLTKFNLKVIGNGKDIYLFENGQDIRFIIREEMPHKRSPSLKFSALGLGDWGLESLQ